MRSGAETARHERTRPRIVTLIASSAVLITQMAVAAPSNAGTTSTVKAVVNSGASTTVGTTGHTLGIGFTFDPFLGPYTGTISIRIPKPASGTAWTTPQTTDPLLPGYVSRNKGTCPRVTVPRVTGTAPGPFTIKVTIDCSGSANFSISYEDVTSPTLAARYKFLTRYKPTGGVFLTLRPQPFFTVVHGPATSLTVAVPSFSIVDGIDPRQLMGVRAVDQYGNLATTSPAGNGEVDLSYSSTCTEEMDHLGTLPTSVSLSDGRGSVEWGPPFMNFIQGVPVGTCFSGTRRVPAFTSVTASFTDQLGTVEGTGQNRVREVEGLEGFSLTACGGEPGWEFTTPGGVQACVRSFVIESAIPTSLGISLTGTLLDPFGNPIEEVKLDVTDPNQNGIVISGGTVVNGVYHSGTELLVTNCQLLPGDLGGIRCHSNVDNVSPTKPLLVDKETTDLESPLTWAVDIDGTT